MHMKNNNIQVRTKMEEGLYVTLMFEVAHMPYKEITQLSIFVIKSNQVNYRRNPINKTQKISYIHT